jgi:hypothetical protein
MAVPQGLSLKRSRDLEGRGAHPLIRRAFLALLAVVALLALANVFGQHPDTTSAGSAVAALQVQAPTRLRGGLIYQGRFQIRARRGLKTPTLVLSSGWLESMSINSIEPNPSQQESRAGTLRLTFDALPAGEAMTVWIYFQVNPTNVGERQENIDVKDGETELAHINRSMTIFP